MRSSISGHLILRSLLLGLCERADPRQRLNLLSRSHLYTSQQPGGLMIRVQKAWPRNRTL